MKKIVFLLLYLALHHISLNAISIAEKEKAATHIDSMYSLDSYLEGVLHLSNGELLTYGSSGTIMKSKDLGINWEQRFSGTQRHIYDIKELNNKLYAVGENGLYMTSIDYGKSWKILDFVDNELLLNIEYNNLNNNEMIISSASGKIYYSENKGKDWQIIRQDTLTELIKTEIKFHNDVVYYFDNKGIISYSNDLGKNWDSFDIKKIDTINPYCTYCTIVDVQIKNNDFYILTQSSFLKINFDEQKYFNYKITQFVQSFKLLDNGEIALYTSPSNDKFLSYYKINLNGEIKYIGQQEEGYLIERSLIKGGVILENGVCLVVGANKTIFRTSDNGLNWNLISYIDVKYIDNLTNWIEGMKWVSDKVGFIYLKDKYIYRTTDAGVTWKPQKIGDDSNNKPKEELIKLIHFDDDNNILMIKKDPSSDNQNQNILYRSNDNGETFKNVATIYGKPILNLISTEDTYYIGVESFALDSNYATTLFYKYDNNFNLVDNILVPKCQIDYMDITKEGNLILFGEFFTYKLPEFPYFKSIIKQIEYNIVTKEIIDKKEFKGSPFIKYYYKIGDKKFLTYPDTNKVYRDATPDSSAGFLYNMCVYYCDNDSFDFELVHKDTTYNNFIPQNEKAYFLKEASVNVSTDFGKTFVDSLKVNNEQIFIKHIYNNSNNVTYITTDCDRRFLLNKMILFRSIEPDFVSSVENENYKDEDINYLYTMPPYPNPTRSEVTAKFYWDSRIDIDNSEIAVFDLNGNNVSGKENLTLEKLNEWSGNIKWNCTGVPSGTYLIKIQHGNNTKSVKVVVN